MKPKPTRATNHQRGLCNQNMHRINTASRSVLFEWLRQSREGTTPRVTRAATIAEGFVPVRVIADVGARKML